MKLKAENDKKKKSNFLENKASQKERSSFLL